MSETSETKGRCRQRLEEAYSGNKNFVPPYAWITADAIDRLAADVAAIRAKVDAISPEDVRHFVESEKAWVRLVEEKETAAIRERDEARAEVKRLKAARAAPQPAGQGISPGLLETQPTQNAAPAPGWLTDEERHILGAHLQSLRDQRRAMERGGQTLGYSADPCGLKREADVIDNLLARAGSPPVVEVPMISRRDVPMQNEAFAYRDAMNKAGVKWKEMGRE